MDKVYLKKQEEFMKELKLILILAFLAVPLVSFAQGTNAVTGADDAMKAADDANAMMDETNAADDNMADDAMNATDTNMVNEADDAANDPQALAIIEGTTENSELYGEVELTQTNEGVMVNAEVYNAPPGKHGFHVHENGSCEDKGNAAGGHFNPAGAQHGMITKDGEGKAHEGDMGNIDINAEGEGTLSLVIPGASLTEGKNNIVGKAIILHEKEDDFSQPTGNAGSRIGCGVIETISEE